MGLTGGVLLHEVGKRIIAEYLRRQGRSDVTVTPSAFRDDPLRIDIRYTLGTQRLAAKVKVDCYYGTDPALIADRNMSFYRPDSRGYALEETADTTSGAAGWVSSSQADALFYYRIAIPLPEAEVARLYESPDAVFFKELGVERDDLRIIPLGGLRAWFLTTRDRYTPRPVMADGKTAWYRIVPIQDLDAGVPGIRAEGAVYRFLSAV